jgi:hypothetical protein
MTPANVIATLQAVDALLALLQNAGIGMEKIRSMREQNASGRLTDEQVAELAESAKTAVDRLG